MRYLRTFRKQPAVALAAFCLILSGLVSPVEARTRKGDRLLEQGKEAEVRKEYEKALELYEQAMISDPRDSAYQLAARRVRFQAGMVRVDAGQKLRAAGRLEDALIEFQKAYAIDPSSNIAEQEIRKTRKMIEDEKRKASGAASAEPPKPEDRGLTPIERAQRESEEKSDRIMAAPELKPINPRIDTLKMNNQPVKVLYETLGKIAGINVVFDPEYQPPPGRANFTIDLSNTTLEEALENLAVQTKSFWKPLSSNTIFVTNDNVTKRRDYEDYVVKVFYIKNATSVQELTEITTTIRSVTEIRRAFTYNGQYAILMRGTTDQIALAEKLIQDLDKPKSEVVVDVVVMEANRARTRDIAATFLTSNAAGIKIPINYNKADGDNVKPVPINAIRSIGSGDYSVTAPNFLLQLVMSDGMTRVLQQPQVRAIENFKASLRIGDKIPYATGSFQPGIGVGGGGVSPLVSTQFQFAEVGVNVDITPRVHGRDEISMHVELEISNVSSRVVISGVEQPIISQKKIVHDIRIREGEVNLLGGLMQQQDTKTVAGTPWLMDLPLFGWLFKTDHREKNEGELLIALVPHIVRAPDYTDSNLRGVAAGSDQVLKLNYAPRKEAPPAQAAPSQPSQTPSPTATQVQGAAAQTPPAAAPKPTAPVVTNAPPPTAAPTPATDAPPQLPPQNLPPLAKLFFNPPAVTTPAGSTVTVSLQMEHAPELFSAPMRVKFDPKVVRLTQVRVGGLMGDPTAVNFSERTLNDTGDSIITLNRVPGAGGVSGAGPLLVFTFQAIAKGTSPINLIDLELRDARLHPVAISVPSSSITVQ